jgi:hypothetical protein
MAVAPAEAEARLDAYIDAHIEGWMDELARLCGQPSVSARHEGIDACAGLVATLLRARGLVAEVSPTDVGGVCLPVPSRTAPLYTIWGRPFIHRTEARSGAKRAITSTLTSRLRGDQLET